MIGRASQSAALEEVPELIGELGSFSVDVPLCTRRLLGDTCRNCISGRGRSPGCAVAAAAGATIYESVSSNTKLGFGQGKESIGIYWDLSISHVELVQNVQR